MTEVDCSGFFSRIDTYLMPNLEKKGAFDNEYANGKHIIDFSEKTDELTERQKDDIKGLYLLNLKDQYYGPQEAHFLSFPEAITLPDGLWNDRKYLKNLHEIYDTLRPELGAASRESRLSVECYREMKNQYEARMDIRRAEARERRKAKEIEFKAERKTPEYKLRVKEKRREAKQARKAEKLELRREKYTQRYHDKIMALTYDEMLACLVEDYKNDVISIHEGITEDMKSLIGKGPRDLLLGYKHMFYEYRDRLREAEKNAKQIMKTDEFKAKQREDREAIRERVKANEAKYKIEQKAEREKLLKKWLGYV